MPSTDPPSFRPAAETTMARWRRAAESASDGLWEVSLADGRAWFSDRLARLLGVAPGALAPRVDALAALVHPDHAAEWQAAIDRMRADEQPVEQSLRMRHADGAWRWMALRGRGWRDDAGTMALATGALSDIDDVRRHQQALEQLVDERTARLAAALAEADRGRRAAQHAESAQARFVAHMSHELRTPLAGLLSLVDLARRVATDPAQQRYLEVAMQSGHVLQRTIDDVLDLTHARDPAHEPAHEPFELAEAVAEVLRGAMPLVRSKGLSMRYDWVGDSTWVRGDERRLRQIVGNLVGNAVKFTERGHVAVVSELLADTEAPGRLRLTMRVEDSGPGLSPERAAAVFEDFVQGDPSLTRAHGGTGLGLTIARELARRLGGDVTLRSVVGEGSVFTLALPFDPAPAPEALPPAPPAHAWLLYRQPLLGEWLQRRLERMGWSAELVPGVEAAVERARGAAPDARPPALVVIAEHVLTPAPDLDALRHALPDSHVSLLIRPDWNQPALEQRALALDMALDVMPLTPRGLRQMTGRRAPPPPAPIASPVGDDAGHVLVVEDNAINRMIAEEFLHAIGLASRSAADGAQALQACAVAPPRLVLMDLQMPVMDGLTATRLLRERQRRGELPAFPIVALTAHAMGSDAQACRDAGMDAFLTKPLLLDTLRRELARWCPELQRN